MNNLLIRINENLNRLSPAHKVIANYILDNHEKIPSMTARDLAKETLSVPSSVISFSKKLGYTGFNELKFSYENDNKINQTIDDGVIEAISKASEVTMRAEFGEAVKLLMDAPKIFILAFQMSQIPAKDFYFRMRKIEPSKMIFFEAFIDQARMVSLVGENDVVLIISNSGEADEVLKIERELSKKKCKQILVTNGINSTLSKYVTVELSIGCLEENPILFKEVPTKARYALLYLLERIYLEILNVNYEEKIALIKSSSQYFNG